MQAIPLFQKQRIYYIFLSYNIIELHFICACFNVIIIKIIASDKACYNHQANQKLPHPGKFSNVNSFCQIIHSDILIILLLPQPNIYHNCLYPATQNLFPSSPPIMLPGLDTYCHRNIAPKPHSYSWDSPCWKEFCRSQQTITIVFIILQHTYTEKSFYILLIISSYR